MSLLAKARDAVAWQVVRGMWRDAAKGRYGEAGKDMWKFLDGKKTWIGIIVAHAPIVVHEIALAMADGGVDTAGFVKIAGYVLMAVGLIHKLVKGE
jgi:hypothetical protein